MEDARPQSVIRATVRAVSVAGQGATCTKPAWMGDAGGPFQCTSWTATVIGQRRGHFVRSHLVTFALMPSSDASSELLTTSLAFRHAFLNHAALPVVALAASSKTGDLVVCDGRILRRYSSAGQQLHQVALPATVRAAPARTPERLRRRTSTPRPVA